MIIKGDFNEAEVFTENIDKETISQVKVLLNQEFVKNSNVKIMPDCHKGAGCVIGTTMTIKDKIVPNLVGVDIGCGVLCVELSDIKLDLEKIDDFIKNKIPHGFKINNKAVVDYLDEISKVRCIDKIPKKIEEFNRALGSLGGGNHFIEIDKDENDNKYLVIHSGSRNLGLQVANYYQNVGYESLNYISDEYKIKAKELIESYKNSGKKKRIEKDLKKLKESFRVKSKVPKDLCYVEGKDLEDYLHDMDIIEPQMTNDIITSYMFSQRINREIRRDHDVKRMYGAFTEIMLSAPAPSFIGFDFDDDGRIKYEFDYPEVEGYSMINEIQDGIHDFVNDYTKHFAKYPCMMNICGSDAYAVCRQVISCPEYFSNLFADYPVNRAVGSASFETGSLGKLIENEFVK